MARQIVDFSFCCSQRVCENNFTKLTMSDGVAENDRQREFPVRDDGGTEAELGANVDDAMETILNDPRRKAALLQRMGLDEPSDPGRRDSYQSHLTPSGKSTGGWSYPPGPLWPFPQCHTPDTPCTWKWDGLEIIVDDLPASHLPHRHPRRRMHQGLVPQLLSRERGPAVLERKKILSICWMMLRL